jgi:hypothetical protein
LILTLVETDGDTLAGLFDLLTPGIVICGQQGSGRDFQTLQLGPEVKLQRRMDRAPEDQAAGDVISLDFLYIMKCKFAGT